MKNKFGKDYTDFLLDETKKKTCNRKKGNCYLVTIERLNMTLCKR